jgi:hypothetical protein
VSDNGTSGYDPAAALRALADAPRVGFEAAAAVIDRILSLGRPQATPLPPISWDGTNGDALPPPGDRRVQLRRARADAERVLDAYGDWARQLLDAVFGLAEGDGPGDVLVLGPVAAGQAVDADLWLHAPPGRLTVPAPLHATALTRDDGTTLDASTVSFDPPALLPTANGNGSGPATRVSLRVPDGTGPGTYHGHVLAAGVPEVALPLRAEVVA